MAPPSKRAVQSRGAAQKSVEIRSGKENEYAQRTPSKDVVNFKATPGASAEKGRAANLIESKSPISPAAGHVTLLAPKLARANASVAETPGTAARGASARSRTSKAEAVVVEEAATKSNATSASIVASSQTAPQPVVAAVPAPADDVKQSKRHKSSMLPISEVSIAETADVASTAALEPTISVLLENDASASSSYERRTSSMRRRSSLHPVLSQAIQEEEEAAPAPMSLVTEAVAFAAPSSSERRKSSMRRRSSLHPVLEAQCAMPSEDEVVMLSDNAETSAVQDSMRRKSSIRRRSSVHPIFETNTIEEDEETNLETTPALAAADADVNESSDDMEMTAVLPAIFAAPTASAEVSVASSAMAALKSPGNSISSQKIESLVNVFESKLSSSSAPKLAALKSPRFRNEQSNVPFAAQAVAHAEAARAPIAPSTKPAPAVEDKASLVRNLIKRIESNHQAISGTPCCKGDSTSNVSTPNIQSTAACTPHSAAVHPAAAVRLPSAASLETDNSVGPFATTLSLPLSMAALLTPNTSYIVPAITSALNQSSFADTPAAYPALDASLNASMDCSLNGSFSDARQSKTKPAIMVTQADKVRRDAEKKAAEVESASALRLDSEAKHKAARERRLQLEEENRRKLEEGEKAKREREAAKQAAVKAQLDEEQLQKREEEEKRKRQREHAAAFAEKANPKEQAHALQKVPAALVASSSAISTQQLGTCDPNKTEQTSISALIAPTVVPATTLSPVTVNQLFRLRSSQSVKCTTLASDKFVCVREMQAPGSSSDQISIFDTSKSYRPIKSVPISAAFAIMNPDAKVIAITNRLLWPGANLVLINIETKSELTHYMATPLVFWKWISPSIIAFVSGNAVFHWTMDGDSAPSKIFDCDAGLAAREIINYTVDDKIAWCCLTGISKTPDGRIGGSMQLFSIERQKTQTIEGHACAFVDLTLAGNTTPSTLFAFANRGAAESSINIIEVAKAVGPPETTVAFGKRKLTLNFPPEAAGDFPVLMSISNKYGIVVVVTKLGYVQLFETESGAFIYGNRFTESPVVIGCSNSIGGIHCINDKGQLLALGIDEANIIPFLVQGGNAEAAIKLAGRCQLPGGEDLYSGQLDAFLKQGNLEGAVQAAANSPGGILRTASTIQKFKSIQAPPNTPPPLLQYFGQLLEKKVVGPDGSMQPGKLNPLESVELARLVLSQGKGQLLQQWLTDNRLEASEELGDLLRQLQSPETYKLALKIYLDCKAHDKGINCFLDLGMIPQILVYCKRVNYNPDWTPILDNVLMRNPDMAQQLAVSLFNNDGAQPLCDPQAVCELFFSRNLIQQGTAFALESLKSNQPQFAVLQTKVLEMNLRNPAGLRVADAIIQNADFTRYDRPKIGGLCEKAGLFQRALEHYTEIEDIKRCIVQTHSINPEFLITFFGNLSAEWGILCLKALLDSNIRTNLQLVVQIATKYVNELGVQPLVQIFNDTKSPDGMFFFLGAIVNSSEDPDVHFEYIAAAANLGISTNDFKEVERVTRESDYYPAEKTKNFLKELKVPDICLIVQSLVNVCNRHGFVKELTEYLFHGGQAKAIEVYVTKYNPQRTPEVVSSLIENGAGDDVVKSLIMAVGSFAPMAELIQVFEEHHKLKMLLPWLEARMDEGAQDEALHNALAKIYIDTAQNPEKFLEENRFYNSLVVGKYCETRDPHYSVICYKRGGCDDELIAVTSAHGLHKDQAMYLIQRKDQELWAKVLRSEDAEARQRVVDQVVQVGQYKNADEVSETVKAFMSADCMPSALIALLEKIVLLQGSEFGQNKNLQNLLIITAIRADATRVMGYINRMDKFDATDTAEFCVAKELFEEAVVIYKRNKMIVPAVNVLIENLKDLERGLEFAKTVDDHEVWSCLARAQLFANRIGDAVDSIIKVIDMGQQNETWPELIRFLTMARKKVKDQRIDTCMTWSFCKINQLANLEEFITAPNIAQILVVGEHAYDQGLYEAACILFHHISEFGKLASTLVRLAKYSDAVEAARKANYSRTWKDVLEACVDAKEFRLGQMCGLNLISNADEIEDVMKTYERRGCFDQLITLMEAGVAATIAGGAGAAIFTELAILYAKFKPKKLMEHIKLYQSRFQLPKVIRECERHRHFSELNLLFMQHQEYDNAAGNMMEHPSVAWDHTQFKECLNKVANPEVYYRAINFYLNHQPQFLNEVLISQSKKIDHTLVVTTVVKEHKYIKEYMLQAQPNNIAALNEAINALLIDDEDHVALRTSVDTYDNFDQVALAVRLETHELLEMRLISAHLYKRNGKFAQSTNAELERLRLFVDPIMHLLHCDQVHRAAKDADYAFTPEWILIYLRLSDPGQLLGCSLEYQMLEIMAFLTEARWTHVSRMVVHEVACGADLTKSQPQLKAFLQEYRGRSNVAVVFATMDRFTRGVQMAADILNSGFVA